MERYGFAVTTGAGLLSCGLLSWQGFEGPGGDWVPGFLCVLWSLLMLARLIILTTPNTISASPHLAQKIIHSLHQKQEDKRGSVLQQSFNTSFAIFVVLGFLLCGWQLFYSLYQNAPDHSMAAFLQENGHNSWFSATSLFDWGQALSYLLCLSMMGFLLRSYATDIKAVRPALLVFSGYIAAGLILFCGLSQNWSMPDHLSFIGYESASASLLIDTLMQETGIIGLVLLALMFAVPQFFIWFAMDRIGTDWVVQVSGLIAFLGLAGSLFVGVHPALGGFVFLCAMSVFLAWGASERMMQAR